MPLDQMAQGSQGSTVLTCAGATYATWLCDHMVIAFLLLYIYCWSWVGDPPASVSWDPHSSLPLSLCNILYSSTHSQLHYSQQSHSRSLSVTAIIHHHHHHQSSLPLGFLSSVALPFGISVALTENADKMWHFLNTFKLQNGRKILHISGVFRPANISKT